MLKALLPLVLGILMGRLVEFHFINYLPIVIILAFVLILIVQFKYVLSYRKALFSFSYYLIMLLLGIWSISIYKPALNTNHFSNYEGNQVVGVIDDEPIYKEKTIRFPIRVIAVVDDEKTASVEGKLVVTLLRDSIHESELKYGDKIVFKNKITETAGPLNPNEFNYKRYLENKGIWHQCFLTGTEWKVIGRAQGNFVIEKSLDLRQRLIDKFSLYIHNVEAYQIAIALIFGYRSQLEVSTLEAFTSTGTIHVLSVSGLHVSLVFGLLTIVLIWLDRFKYGKIIRCLIILFSVWVYVVLTGMSPSILRAGIMISFFILAMISGRRQIALNTLFTSALFILILAPENLFDIGFQLSYSAILGILLFYPLLKKIWLPKNKWLTLIVEFCYVSIAAQLFTMPLALYYFGQFPIYFLLANLFIAIPSTVIMYLGIAMALCPFNWLNNMIGMLLDWVLIFSVDGLKVIAGLPLSVSRGIVWDGFQVTLLSLLLLFLVHAINYGRKISLFIACSFFFIQIGYFMNMRMLYANYYGYRIYNVRSEIAIAHIMKGKVVLMSTIDSLQHNTIKFSVLPDLKRYAKIEDITFVKLSNEKRSNYELIVGNQHLLIIENILEMDNMQFYDIVLWRKNNRNDFGIVSTNFPKAKFIIDGSNGQKTIDRFQNVEINGNSIYVLKNNFAYVWDRE